MELTVLIDASVIATFALVVTAFFGVLAPRRRDKVFNAAIPPVSA
jgi:hypothetical protein